MPTNRTRRRRMQIEIGGVPEVIYQTFTSFHGYLLGLDDGWHHEHNEEEHRAAWAKYREAILARDQAENEACGRRIGRRSWAYFQYDLEPVHPRVVVGKEKYHAPWGDGTPVERPNGKDVYEDDAQYLARLGLLYEWEIDAMHKADHQNAEKRRS